LSAEATEEAVSKPAGFKMLAIVGLLTLVVGGGVGAFVVGPKMAGGAPSHGDDEAAEESGGGHGSKKNDHGGGASALFAVDNLVVNPAGTKGTRFLIVSISFEADNAKTVDALKEHEAEIRDVLHAVLSAKTVDEVSDVALREQIKSEMQQAVEAVVKPGKVKKLFIPQFVLQ
jgi:flagellar FliL protein